MNGERIAGDRADAGPVEVGVGRRGGRAGAERDHVVGREARPGADGERGRAHRDRGGQRAVVADHHCARDHVVGAVRVAEGGGDRQHVAGDRGNRAVIVAGIARRDAGAGADREAIVDREVRPVGDLERGGAARGRGRQLDAAAVCVDLRDGVIDLVRVRQRGAERHGRAGDGGDRAAIVVGVDRQRLGAGAERDGVADGEATGLVDRQRDRAGRGRGGQLGAVAHLLLEADARVRADDELSAADMGADAADVVAAKRCLDLVAERQRFATAAHALGRRGVRGLGAERGGEALLALHRRDAQRQVAGQRHRTRLAGSGRAVRRHASGQRRFARSPSACRRRVRCSVCGLRAVLLHGDASCGHTTRTPDPSSKR